ncbi:TMIG1 protein, partial [Amia calva]|nr:TMIG1 protein [Amia calva]
CTVLVLPAVQVSVHPAVSGGVISAQREDTLTLTCEAVEREGDEELDWYRETQRISLGPENRVNTSSLCVSPVSKADNRVTFTCQLRREASVNASIQLDVHFPPELSGTELVTMAQNQQVTFTCDVHANPPVSVSWMKNNERLNLDTGGYTLYQDGREATLSINKIQKSHEGNYSCVTDSPEYGQRTKSFTLTVEGEWTRFPYEPVIAGGVIVLCTMILAVISRKEKIAKVS